MTRAGNEGRESVLDLFDMSDMIAVVTGGGTHLGFAMATGLAELGAHVVLASRTNSTCRERSDELQSMGLSAEALECDVTKSASVDHMVEDLVDRYGRVDVLVSNAGGALGTGVLAPDTGQQQLKVEDAALTFDLNVLGTLRCVRAVVPHMKSRGQGSIITIGSIHASVGPNPSSYVDGFNRTSIDYHASKGAVVALSRAMATELGPWGIRVNTISPGQIPGPRVPLAQAERFAQAIPLNRAGTPSDLKGAVGLLGSDAGRWITGLNLIVDGGWTAW